MFTEVQVKDRRFISIVDKRECIDIIHFIFPNVYRWIYKDESDRPTLCIDKIIMRNLSDFSGLVDVSNPYQNGGRLLSKIQIIQIVTNYLKEHFYQSEVDTDFCCIEEDANDFIELERQLYANIYDIYEIHKARFDRYKMEQDVIYKMIPNNPYAEHEGVA